MQRKYAFSKKLGSFLRLFPLYIITVFHGTKKKKSLLRLESNYKLTYQLIRYHTLILKNYNDYEL